MRRLPVLFVVGAGDLGHRHARAGGGAHTERRGSLRPARKAGSVALRRTMLPPLNGRKGPFVRFELPAFCNR